MKFGKRLKHQIKETLPEWKDKFLRYKDLKKLVNLIASAPHSAGYGEGEAEFVELLNIEMEKFNTFFIEQEEDFIIRHTELQERIQSLNLIQGTDGSQPQDYTVEMERIKKDMINFHGEMVLLENYSNINYIGLAKILKKYDKRTGGLLRLPFIQSVLQQPFLTTSLVSKLIKECESTIDAVFPSVEEKQKRAQKVQGKASTSVVGESIFRSTVAALVTMQEIRRGSSTYSQFSLPPLDFPDHDLNQGLEFHSPIVIP